MHFWYGLFICILNSNELISLGFILEVNKHHLKNFGYHSPLLTRGQQDNFYYTLNHVLSLQTLLYIHCSSKFCRISFLIIETLNFFHLAKITFHTLRSKSNIFSQKFVFFFGFILGTNGFLYSSAKKTIQYCGPKMTSPLVTISLFFGKKIKKKAKRGWL